MSTIKMKLEHQVPSTTAQLLHDSIAPGRLSDPNQTKPNQVTWQLRKCTCMILALPATFNQLYHGYFWFNLFNSLGEHWLGSQEKSRKIKVKTQSSFLILVVHSTHSGTNVPKVMKSDGFCLAHTLQ
jgi:hypothetical protein|eukprot:sb/3475519/